MNIHEHQAKEILRDFGAPVSNGVVILKPEELNEKINCKIRTKSNGNNKNSVGKEKFIFSKKKPNSLIETDKGAKNIISHKILSILKK